jgi:sugar phosphate isomerase/epimerase
MADDPELHRARDTFAALAEAARPYGLRPAIEAIRYMHVKTLSDAAVLVGESGGGIIIDPLHLQRGGGTPGDVRSLDPKLIAYCQLCDAPLAPPHNLPRPRELPRGQTAVRAAVRQPGAAPCRRPVQPGRISAGHGPANQGRVRNEVTP